MSSSEPLLKKVKVEHEPDGPFGCPFCFESCRVRGRGVDALLCKGCETTWHRACGKVEGEEGGSGGEEEAGGGEEGVAKKASGGGIWRTGGVGVCVYRTKNGPIHLKQHKAAIHNVDIVWHDCPELGCEYMTKAKSNIKKHRADIHDIGVTWHECRIGGCV